LVIELPVTTPNFVFNPWAKGVQVSPELLQIEKERNKVDSATNAATSRKELKEERLYVAKGSINAYQSKIERALLLATARPLDCDGRLITESAPIYLLFHETCSVFRLQAFNSQEFKALVSEMKKVQEDWANKRIEVPAAVSSELEKLVHTALTPHFKHLEDVLQTTNAKIDKLAASYEGRQGSGIGVIGHGVQTSTVVGSTSLFENENVGVNEQHAAEESLGFRADGKTPRKRKRAVSRSEDFAKGKVQVLMSTENKTLDHFWQEFAHGSNGNVALRLLEAEGMGWRRDPKGSSKFKVFWGYRSPIYKLVSHYIDSMKLSEEEALDRVRPLFDSIPTSRSGKPNLKVLSKLLTLELNEIKKPKAAGRKEVVSIKTS
jgi:hypothetical protein